MKPVVLNVTIPATVLNCLVNTGEEVVGEPSPDIPELKALNHYAGQWDDEISGRPGVQRTEIGEWILNGRFLRQSWSTESKDGTAPAQGLTLMTFDPAAEIYRSWSFLATGTVIENEGTWDETTLTFTWGHRLMDAAGTVMTKASFPSENSQAWYIVKTDENHKIVREVTGRSIRRGVPDLHAA
jgi:hypothetical protein